jgi:hypothetical protein
MNMRCLVAASKPVNNTWAIARQLIRKRVPAAKDMHATTDILLDYKNGNGVFYVVRAAGSVEFRSQLSVQLSEAT